MTTVELIPAANAASNRPEFPERHNLLSISPIAQDHAALRGIADEHEWQVWSVKTLEEAVERLASQRFAAVFCDSALEDGSWKDILERIGNGDAAPPLVVTSRLADANLWSEVLNLGGYDVLTKPYYARDVSHVLTTLSLRPAAAMRVRTAGAL